MFGSRPAANPQLYTIAIRLTTGVDRLTIEHRRNGAKIKPSN